MNKNNIQDDLVKILVGGCLDIKGDIEKFLSINKVLFNDKSNEFINKVVVGFDYDKEDANKYYNFLQKNICKNNKPTENDIVNSLIEIKSSSDIDKNVIRAVIISYLITNKQYVNNINDFFEDAENMYKKIINGLQNKVMKGGALDKNDLENMAKYFNDEMILVRTKNMLNGNKYAFKFKKNNEYDKINVLSYDIILKFKNDKSKTNDVHLYKNDTKTNTNLNEYLNNSKEDNINYLDTEIFNMFIKSTILSISTSYFISYKKIELDEIISNKYDKILKLIYTLYNNFFTLKGFNVDKCIENIIKNSNLNTVLDKTKLKDSLEEFKKIIKELLDYANKYYENPI